MQAAMLEDSFIGRARTQRATGPERVTIALTATTIQTTTTTTVPTLAHSAPIVAHRGTSRSAHSVCFNVVFVALWCTFCCRKFFSKNPYTGKSPYANRLRLPWDSGNDDKAIGPGCKPCCSQWQLGGWTEEYDCKREQYSAPLLRTLVTRDHQGHTHPSLISRMLCVVYVLCLL